MKNILFLLLLIGLWSCQDDDNYLDAPISQVKLDFKEIAGGAIMYYQLPKGEDIQFICVRYEDARGNKIKRTGSYLCDSMLLIGFDEAQSVSASVTLCNGDEVESKSMDITFTTKDSGPVAFFDDVRVASDWNGFSLAYSVDENAKGIAHVLYAGKDPYTQEPDTLLIKSFPIKAGKDTLIFRPQQENSKYDVIVRTEDYRGYMVKEKVWKDVEAYLIMKLDPSELLFEDLKLSRENETEKLGWKYLFDGDIKGEKAMLLPRKEYNTYLAGPNALKKDLFIIDLKKPVEVAQVRIYAMLNIDKHFGYSTIWESDYDCKLPCNVRLYGSTDKVNWKEIYHFEQDREIAVESRWSPATGSYRVETSREVINAAEPEYIDMSLPASGEQYRYLKIRVDDVFKSATAGYNYSNYVTMHELEIYVKKD